MNTRVLHLGNRTGVVHEDTKSEFETDGTNDMRTEKKDVQGPGFREHTLCRG